MRHTGGNTNKQETQEDSYENATRQQKVWNRLRKQEKYVQCNVLPIGDVTFALQLGPSNNMQQLSDSLQSFFFPPCAPTPRNIFQHIALAFTPYGIRLRLDHWNSVWGMGWEGFFALLFLSFFFFVFLFFFFFLFFNFSSFSVWVRVLRVWTRLQESQEANRSSNSQKLAWPCWQLRYVEWCLSSHRHTHTHHYTHTHTHTHTHTYYHPHIHTTTTTTTTLHPSPCFGPFKLDFLSMSATYCWIEKSQTDIEPTNLAAQLNTHFPFACKLRSKSKKFNKTGRLINWIYNFP
jgi:hypothetical protein